MPFPVELKSSADKILPEMIELRHEFHRHPEIRLEERWTSERIARFLDENGVAYQKNFAGTTGIVAELKGKSEKTIALRADMDALEIHEETGLPYASEIPRRMHACGHDGHMAALCGAVKVLKARENQLPSNVRFIFQPGEELVCAARLMAEGGAVDGIDAIFGLHGWPELPLGKIAVNPGPFMASADFFKITVKGKGCHAAQPADGIDPITAGAQIVTALQTIISRESEPWGRGIVTVASFNAGTGTNIIPETAELAGTFRAFSEKEMDDIRVAIRRIATCTANALGAEADIEFGEHIYPPLNNDPACAEYIRETASGEFGAEYVIAPAHPAMGSEDFAYYLERIPGAFCFIGLSGESPGPPLHNARFDFPDTALPHAIRLFAALALNYGGDADVTA